MATKKSAKKKAVKKVVKKSGARRERVGYVDGFVIALPKNKVAEYRKMAKLGEKLWMKHGALDYKECLIDDAKPQWAELIFPKMISTKPSETVIFSYIGYKSRTHRDQVNAKVIKDPEMSPEKHKDKPMPFEMNRMAYGGFKVIVGA